MERRPTKDERRIRERRYVPTEVPLLPCRRPLARKETCRSPSHLRVAFPTEETACRCSRQGWPSLYCHDACMWCCRQNNVPWFPLVVPRSTSIHNAGLSFAPATQGRSHRLLSPPEPPPSRPLALPALHAPVPRRQLITARNNKNQDAMSNGGVSGRRRGHPMR